jgi:hypothetical protein
VNAFAITFDGRRDVDLNGPTSVSAAQPLPAKTHQEQRTAAVELVHVDVKKLGNNAEDVQYVEELIVAATRRFDTERTSE